MAVPTATILFRVVRGIKPGFLFAKPVKSHIPTCRHITCLHIIQVGMLHIA